MLAFPTGTTLCTLTLYFRLLRYFIRFKFLFSPRPLRSLRFNVLIRVHSRNSRLLLLDLRPSAEICGDVLGLIVGLANCQLLCLSAERFHSCSFAQFAAKPI